MKKICKESIEINETLYFLMNKTTGWNANKIVDVHYG